MDLIVGKIWYFLISIFVIFEDVPDELSGFYNNRKYFNKRTRSIIFGSVVFAWFVGLSVLLMTIIYFMYKSTVFIVTANVEQVSVSPYKEQRYPEWSVREAILHADCGQDSVTVTGILYPDFNSYIEFIRIQKNELTINLDNEEGGSAGFFVTYGGSKIELDDCAVLRLPFGENYSYVFPLEGEIKLGGYIKEGSNSIPILHRGNVTILDKAFVSRVYYSVGPFDLKMGDVFYVEGLDIESSGFIHVDNEKGMNITYSSKGDRGYIKNYRTEKIEIKNGFWTKIYNDQSLILLWFMSVIIFAICKAIIRIKLSENKYSTRNF